METKCVEDGSGISREEGRPEMLVMIFAALLGWALFLWLGALFGTLVPGVVESRTENRYGRGRASITLNDRRT